MLTTETKVDIYERWNKVASILFSEMGQDDSIELATLLENQRLMNQLATNPNAQFQRISIPLVRRVFGPDFWLRNIVEFSAMSGPADGVVVAKTRWLNTRFTPPPTSTIQGCSNLDNECEYTAELSNQISEDITKEILRDLLNNVGTASDDIDLCLEGILAKSGRPAEWAVCHGEFDDSVLRERLTVYKTECLDKNTLLFGNNNYGYYYCPYVPFTLTGQKPDEMNETYGMLMRCGKKLFSSNGYGKVTLS